MSVTVFSVTLRIPLFVKYLLDALLREVREEHLPERRRLEVQRSDDGYLARITHALRLGDPAADTLVLHPLRSGWLEYSTVDATAVDVLDDRFNDLIDDLLCDHVPFDLGDEWILDRHGTVEEVSDDARLTVVESSYGTVVVPYCTTLSAGTVALLEEFVAAGGNVLLVGDPPERIDGRRTVDELESLVSALNAVDRTALVGLLPRPVRLIDEADEETAASVRVHARRLEDGLVAFLANTDRDAAVDFTLELPGTGRLTRWDAVDGTAEPIATESTNGRTRASVTLHETGSMLVTLDETHQPAANGGSLGRRSATAERTISSTWTVERANPNKLVLDACELALDGAERGWTNVAKHWPHETSIDDPATHPFRATYRFDASTEIVGEPLAVVVESADEQHVAFSGTDLRIPTNDGGTSTGTALM